MSRKAGLRLAMTADAVGGVWQYSTELAAELCGGGHQVTIALLGSPPTDEQRRPAERIEGLRLVETGEALDWLASGPKAVEKAARAVAALAAEQRADLVHCNHPALAGAAAFGVPLVAVAHGCVATWWEAARRTPLDPSYAWHREMMRRGLVAADAVVTPSASFGATVQRVYGLTSAPIVVHNGRNAPISGPKEPTSNAVLTIGRLWDEVKGAALLDQVAAHVEWPLLAAGPLRGPHGETIALNNMQSIGQVDDARLHGLLAERPIVVSAATFEPFGLAVLEAAMAGCALVLSDIDTFRELWDGAAIFVDPADAAGFVAAINSLAADPARRHALGEAATARASRYTPAATAAKMRRIYAGVLEKRKIAA